MPPKRDYIIYEHVVIVAGLGLDEATGKVWAAHCAQEIGNWGVFLPDLYRLYKVVNDPRRNPFADMAVSGRDRAAHYKSIPTHAS